MSYICYKLYGEEISDIMDVADVNVALCDKKYRILVEKAGISEINMDILQFVYQLLDVDHRQ